MSDMQPGDAELLHNQVIDYIQKQHKKHPGLKSEFIFNDIHKIVDEIENAGLDF